MNDSRYSDGQERKSTRLQSSSYSRDYKELKGRLENCCAHLNLSDEETITYKAFLTSLYKRLVLADDEEDVKRAKEKLEHYFEPLKAKAKNKDTKPQVIAEIAMMDSTLTNVAERKAEHIDKKEEGLACREKEIYEQAIGGLIFALGTGASLITFGAGIVGALVITAWNVRDNKKQYDDYLKKNETSVAKSMRICHEIDAIHQNAPLPEAKTEALINGKRFLSGLGTALAAVAFASIFAFPVVTIPLAITAAVVIGGSLAYQGYKFSDEINQLEQQHQRIDETIWQNQKNLNREVVADGLDDAPSPPSAKIKRSTAVMDKLMFPDGKVPLAANKSVFASHHFHPVPKPEPEKREDSVDFDEFKPQNFLARQEEAVKNGRSEAKSSQAKPSPSFKPNEENQEDEAPKERM